MPESRLYYLDNLKIFLIILVILHHVGQGYGPSGGWWFYMTPGPEKIEWMGRFFCVNASFFMGLFFMVSGYFFGPSFDRKGFRKYAADKLIRYGIPLVFVYWILMPPIFYFNYELYTENPSLLFFTFFRQIYLGFGGQPDWFSPTLTWPLRKLGFGHLWFVENLLVYALLYGLLRVVLRKTNNELKFNINIYLFTVAYIVLVVFATVMVRDHHQVGDIENVFGFLMIEVAHWPIYLGSLFSGIIASHTDLFRRFPSKYGRSLLAIGCLMALKVYCPQVFPDFINSLSGKYFEIFETILGFSLSFGLLVLFRDKLNFSNRILGTLSANAYAAYIFHYPIVIVLQFSFDKLTIHLPVKFALVGILSIIATFAFSYLVRLPRIVRRVL